MTRIKKLFNKTWVFIAAAAIIAGSSSTMAFALNNNKSGNASANAVSYIAPVKANYRTPASKAETTVEYTVVDLSKRGLDDEQKNAFRDKLSRIKGITPQQIEEKYNSAIANTIPGEKDITAEQAASYAAGIIKKAYGADLTGYTAQAGFSRNPVPGSDIWGVIFHAPNEVNSSKRYSVSVDSVKGTMLAAGVYSLDYTLENSKDVKNPEWKDIAVQEISKLIPENVSIADSKVISATPEIGVTVVCILSDGSACGARLTGENKEAAAIIYFPNGYDGSMDYHQPTENGVG
jgi:hypothetical protein